MYIQERKTHNDRSWIHPQYDLSIIQQQVVTFEGIEKLRLNKNIKIFINLFLGPVLFGWLAWSVWKEVSATPDLYNHARELSMHLTQTGTTKIMGVMALMLANWGMEAVKWKWLLENLCSISWKKSFQSVLAGVAFSFATPNRIGDYGGRILYIPDGHRLQAVSLNIIGSLLQLLITLSAGLLASFMPGEKMEAAFTDPAIEPWLQTARWVTAAFIIGCILLMLNYRKAIQLCSGVPLLGYVTRHFQVLAQTNARQWSWILFISLLRYLIFTCQYVLILQAMQVNISWPDGIMAVAIFFFLMSVIPSITLLELGMRWQYSLLVFGIFSTNLLSICTAATAIWIINLVIPASIGSLQMLGFRFSK